MPELTATLIIGRTRSKCGRCKRPTLGDGTHHDRVIGYGVEPAPGCGARFVDLATDDIGGTEARLISCRPDLPLRPANPTPNLPAPTGQPIPIDRELLLDAVRGQVEDPYRLRVLCEYVTGRRLPTDGDVAEQVDTVIAELLGQHPHLSAPRPPAARDQSLPVARAAIAHTTPTGD
jgi:hypothetical protein